MQEMETDLEALKEKLMQIYDAKIENRDNEVIIKKEPDYRNYRGFPLLYLHA